MIATGVVVVMGILVVLGLAVELVIIYDNFMYRRAKEKLEAAAHDPERAPNDVMAVIGLAIHQFFQEQNKEVIVTALKRMNVPPWSASGRRDIMTDRGQVINRPKK